MTEYQHPDPIVATDKARDVANDLVVIPNERVQLVPNIGVIGGREAVLVVDTGLGPANGRRVLDFAMEFAAGRRLYLTSTHFHPEHAFGASAFTGNATYLMNQAQATDLAQRGPGYIEMFKTLGEPIARELRDAEIVTPDVVYRGSHILDLGGRTVTLRETGRAHTKGDQVVNVDDASVLFTGDLVEQGQFSIFPWFPPHDVDVSGLGWIEVMKRLVADRPTTVVPGHNDIGGVEELTETLDYLEALRFETWKRRDSLMDEKAILAEVRDILISRRPEWDGREWINGGVSCLCSEYPKAAR